MSSFGFNRMKPKSLYVIKFNKGKYQMNTDRILTELKQEREKIDTVIGALESIHPVRTRKKRRNISAAGRKRISDAAKRRWAAHKRQLRKAA